MKKRIIFILLFIILLIPLTSCNSSNGVQTNPSYNDNNTVVVDTNGRKVVYHVSYVYDGNDSKTTIKNIKDYLINIDGYISYSRDSDKNASYTYEVPTDKLNEFLDYIDNISGIGNKSVYTNDVTSSYDSNKAKIERLEARKKIYQDELDNNTSLTLEQKLQINDNINQIDNELEQAYLEYNRINNDIDYSTVNIYYNKRNENFGGNFGSVMLSVLKFVGITMAISAPFLVAGGIVLVVFRKKKSKEE